MADSLRAGLRYAWAGVLALSMLGATYVLFDPDLGTPVPLFQEFTCRGRLDVTATNAQGEPTLTMPLAAIFVRAADADNTSRPAYFTLYRRVGEDPWARLLAAQNEDGAFVFSLSDVTDSTEVYVEAKDVEGRVCGGRSETMVVRPSA